MGKKIVSIISAVIVLTVSVCFAGCSKPLEISDADAERILKDIVPKSYEINDIFFGEGLKAVDEAYTEEHTGTAYYPVRDDCGYSSISEIKYAAEEVYSGNYLKEVYVAAFEGMNSSGEDGGVDSSYSARYKEIDGKLNVNVNATKLAIRNKMTVISAKVAESTPEYVKCDVTYEENGKKNRTYLYLTCESDIWLLYSPTY